MRTRVALAAANLAAIVLCLPTWTKHGPSLGTDRLDLDIYRIGGRVWLTGGHLYGALPAAAPGIRLPFTYPPFAAIVLSPLSLIPAPAAAVIVTFGTMALLAVTLRVFLRPLAWPLAWVRAASAAAVAGLVLFVACPQWWFPHGANRELHWAFWEQAAGAAYVAFAAGVLLLSLRIRPGEGSPGARSNAPFRKELDSSGRNRQLQGLTH